MPVLSGCGRFTGMGSEGAPINVAGLDGTFTPASESRRFKVTWNDCRQRIKISSACFVVSYEDDMGGSREADRRELAEMLWPPTKDGILFFDDGSHRHRWYRLTVQFVTPADGLFTYERHHEEDRATAAVKCAVMAHSQSPQDVVVDFPHLGKQLWTSEAFLTAASPYYKALFASGFDEASSKTSELSHMPSVDASYAFVESDAETDEADPKPSKARSSKVVAPYKRVVVVETSYTTYFAVLVWMQTRHVAFAPLASSFRSASSSSAEAEAEAAPVDVPSRKSKVKELVASQNSALPPPVSPKSVYRLADYLSLDDLKSLALANLVSQLTPTNVAYELYSDMATVYLPVRDAVLAYAVDHWREVKDAPATVEMEERGAAGELGAATAGTGMLLARRLAEKLGK
ncbi:hypothetical protein JCM3775_002742 [Rhodotorula graminis]